MVQVSDYWFHLLNSNAFYVYNRIQGKKSKLYFMNVLLIFFNDFQSSLFLFIIRDLIFLYFYAFSLYYYYLRHFILLQFIDYPKHFKLILVHVNIYAAYSLFDLLMHYWYQVLKMHHLEYQIYLWEYLQLMKPLIYALLTHIVYWFSLLSFCNPWCSLLIH